MDDFKGARQLIEEANQLLQTIEYEAIDPRDPIIPLITSWRRDCAAWIRWANSPTINEEGPS